MPKPSVLMKSLTRRWQKTRLLQCKDNNNFINDKMKDEILICDCSSAEHQMVLRFDDDKDLGRMVYVEIHLVNKRWYERLWMGIKYIFGYKCCYGNFEEMILSPKHARQIYGLYRFLNKPNLEYIVEASDANKATVGDKPCGITTVISVEKGGQDD